MTKRITITIPEASIIDAKEAIEVSEVRGWLRDLFTNAPIYTEDVENPDELDAEGNFTGTVSGRIVRAILEDHVFSLAKTVLTNAAIPYQVQEVESQSLIIEEDDADSHIGQWGQRRPGRRFKAFGTFKATGTKPAQTVNISGKEINQWNYVVYLRNMGKNPPRDAVIKIAGDYEVRLKKLLYDTSLAPGINWTFQATVNNVGTGPSKVSSNGVVSGTVLLTGLSVDDQVAVGVAPDQNGQTFKVLGAKIQIARV